MSPTFLIAILIAVLSSVASADVLPSGGFGAEPLGPGSQVSIRWNDDLQAQTVDVGLWNADLQQLTILAANVDAALNEFVWTIPATQPMGARYRFVVRDAERPIRAEFSPSWVSIGLPQPLVASVDAEIDHGTDVRCSPLPAAEHVTVSWEDRDTEQLEIIDVSRRILGSWHVGKGAGTMRLDLRAIPSGSHFLRVRARDGRLVVKPLPILR